MSGLFADDSRALLGYGGALALLVFIGLGFGLMLDGTGTSADLDQEQKLQDQEDEIAALERQVNKLNVSIDLSKEYELKREALPGLKETLAKRQQVLEERAKEISPMKSAMAQTAEDWKAYRVAYLAAAQRAFQGEKLGTLTLPGGKVLEDVVVKEASSKGISVTHSAGTSRLRLLDLPRSFRDRLKADPLPDFDFE